MYHESGIIFDKPCSQRPLIGLFEGMFEENILTFNPGWDQSGNNLDSLWPGPELASIDGTLAAVDPEANFKSTCSK
jgi:hypothetical protein